jgi:hypothetical protein
VPEQRLLSSKICLRRRQSCGTVLGKTPIVLGFSIGRLFIGEGVSSGGDQGVSTQGAGPGAGLRPLLVRLAPSPPLALFRSSSFVREK